MACSSGVISSIDSVGNKTGVLIVGEQALALLRGSLSHKGTTPGTGVVTKRYSWRSSALKVPPVMVILTLVFTSTSSKLNEPSMTLPLTDVISN